MPSRGRIISIIFSTLRKYQFLVVTSKFPNITLGYNYYNISGNQYVLPASSSQVVYVIEVKLPTVVGT